MSTLFSINEPASTRRFALFELGFRPFFLLGSLWAWVSILPWVLSLHGLAFTPHVNTLWWHMHEMIFGFATAIIMGFLLTAAQNWTLVPSASGPLLMLLTALWLLPRIFLPFQSIAPTWVWMTLDVLSNIGVALVLMRMVIRVKQWRNLILVVLVLLLAAFNFFSYSTTLSGDLKLSMHVHEATLFLIAMIMNILGGRVIPFFTERASDFTRRPEPKWLLPLSLLSLAAMSLAFLFASEETIRFLAGLTAMVIFFRFSYWGWQASFKNPLLWSLHLAFVCLPVACALLAFGVPRSGALHVLTIGGIAGLTLSMMSRVSLGHTGRPLKLPPMMPAVFVFIMIAALTRVLASVLTTWYLPLIDGSLLFWLLAFGLFLFHYARILIEPRVDGKRG